MELLRLIAGLGVLTGLLWTGTAVSSVIAVPGALIGMVLLACLVALSNGLAARSCVAAGRPLLRHYGCFFVPAGVGVMDQFAALRSAWFAVAVSVAGSSLLSLVVTAGVMRALSRRADG